MNAMLSDNVTQLRVPPQSVQAEQAVLGGLMLRPEKLDDVLEILSETDFYRRDHALIFRSICEVGGDGKPFDAVVLGEWFERQGLSEHVANGAYLIELCSSTPSAANIRAYAEIVRDKALQRTLIEAGTQAVNSAFEGVAVADTVEALSQRLTELEPKQRGGLIPIRDTLQLFYADLDEKFHADSGMTGLPTQWREVNEATNGLQPAQLIIIAGRPSMGKSIAGLNIALFNALRGKRVALFSLEMGRNECNSRNIASLARIPHERLAKPKLMEEGDWIKVKNATVDVRNSGLWIDDTPGLNVRQFQARARKLHRQQPIDLIVVDHIHDFSIDPKLARHEYGAIAQAGKKMAKDWNIPVVMLAQLNRGVTGRIDRRPTLADLRESGELEQKGDVILFLHREDYYDTPAQKTHLQGVVEMHIAKGRNIESGKRITLKNCYAEMRLDDWEGDLPQAESAPMNKVGRIGRRW